MAASAGPGSDLPSVFISHGRSGCMGIVRALAKHFERSRKTRSVSYAEPDDGPSKMNAWIEGAESEAAARRVLVLLMDSSVAKGVAQCEKELQQLIASGMRPPEVLRVALCDEAPSRASSAALGGKAALVLDVRLLVGDEVGDLTWQPEDRAWAELQRQGGALGAAVPAGLPARVGLALHVSEQPGVTSALTAVRHLVESGPLTGESLDEACASLDGASVSRVSDFVALTGTSADHEARTAKVLRDLWAELNSRCDEAEAATSKAGLAARCKQVASVALASRPHLPTGEALRIAGVSTGAEAAACLAALSPCFKERGGALRTVAGRAFADRQRPAVAQGHAVLAEAGLRLLRECCTPPEHPPADPEGWCQAAFRRVMARRGGAYALQNVAWHCREAAAGEDGPPAGGAQSPTAALTDDVSVVSARLAEKGAGDAILAADFSIRVAELRRTGLQHLVHKSAAQHALAALGEPAAILREASAPGYLTTTWTEAAAGDRHNIRLGSKSDGFVGTRFVDNAAEIAFLRASGRFGRLLMPEELAAL